MRVSAGQASLEYVGLVALLAVAALALAAPTSAGREVVSAVVRQVHRALCVVRGGDCEHDRRPCVVSSRAVDDSGYVDLAIVHVGSRELVLREQRSDGTVAVTYARDRSGGLQLSSGAGAHARLGPLRLHAGLELTAALMGTIGSGTTWVVGDARTADRLVRQLVVEDVGDLGDRVLHAGPDLDGFPPPTTTFGEHAVGVTIGGAAGAGTSGRLSLSSQDVAGEATDAASGQRTYLVRRRNEVVGGVALHGRDQAAGGAGGDEAYTVTVDRDGRPIDLGVVRGQDMQGELRLPGALRRIAGGLAAAGRGGRRWESEQHLDLTDPDSLAVARGFLAQVVSPSPRLGSVAATTGALRRRLDEAGVLDARVYALDDDAGGVDAGGQLGGLALGSGYVRRHERGRLVAAVQRGPDGLWHVRSDCLGEAS